MQKEKKTILKCVWNHKGPQITKANLGKKKKAGGMILSDFKTYCKAKVIKIVCYRPVKQPSIKADTWNRVKSPEINPHLYDHLSSDKGAKMHKDSLFN